MWLTRLFILLLILSTISWQAGSHFAVGVMVLLSMLVPSWVTWELFGFPISVQIAVAIAALGAYCLHPLAIFRSRLGLVDRAMIYLILLHISVDWGYQGFSCAIPLRAYGEWFVPYVAGRLAIQKAEDLRALLPLMVVMVIVFAVISTVQGLTGLNLAETVFGHGQVDKNVPNMSRWGFHRAFGPLKNPNYFGVLQLLLFPSAVYAATRALRHTGPWWWASRQVDPRGPLWVCFFRSREHSRGDRAQKTDRMVVDATAILHGNSIGGRNNCRLRHLAVRLDHQTA
ncbi:MAG: hypothetical protein JWP89_6939 [Schlesneria sp.]|nr:hypothetical protein [Schlesneria sp.]